MPALTCALVEKLETIADPRRQCENLKHPLVDIIIVGLCGILGGCEDFVEIATWAKGNEAFFRSFLALPHGIPSHDTFNRVFALLKPTTLQEVLLPWLLERRGLPGDWIHMDGKTLRGTGRSTPKLKALHVVSAWAGQTGLTLGQVAVNAKSNEITAMWPALRRRKARQRRCCKSGGGKAQESAAARHGLFPPSCGWAWRRDADVVAVGIWMGKALLRRDGHCGKGIVPCGPAARAELTRPPVAPIVVARDAGGKPERHVDEDGEPDVAAGLVQRGFFPVVPRIFLKEPSVSGGSWPASACASQRSTRERTCRITA